jgi:hypothetical protein
MQNPQHLRVFSSERIRLGTSRAVVSSASMKRLSHSSRTCFRAMRCLHPCMHLCHRFAGVSALLCLVFLLMPHTVLAVRHRQRHATSRPAHHRREHHVRPHTARALRRARRHGTEAVRAAARTETQRVARGEDTDSSGSASLNLPEQPLARMNLPPLRGSHESLVRQNTRAEEDGLLRVKDDADLQMLRRQGSLVALPELASMRSDTRLPANRRYCRVWTSHFLTDLARVHYERFHKPLQINSAVRTIQYQRRLLHINGNAAPAEGDVASPHLTGEAVDIAKKGLTPSEVAWMRAYLLPLQTAGRIDVEEEFQQSCFHISVYRAYTTPRPELAAPSKSSALVATGVR